MTPLAQKKCVPCEAGTPPLSREVAQRYLQEIPEWILAEDHIVKEFKFRRYLGGLEFAYSLGKIEKRRPRQLQLRMWL